MASGDVVFSKSDLPTLDVDNSGENGWVQTIHLSGGTPNIDLVLHIHASSPTGFAGFDVAKHYDIEIKEH
jgi:hypothetical protein